MNSKKELRKKYRVSLKQKTKLKLSIAGAFTAVCTFLLIIYFHITSVEEMKARNNLNNAVIEKPVDLNVTQIKINGADGNHSGEKFKKAKPLGPINQQN